MIKKAMAGLMLVCALGSLGCSRNADFGTVDLRRVEEEAPIVKTIKEDFAAKMGELQDQMNKEMEGKDAEEARKVAEDFTARGKLIQSETQNKLKSSLDTAISQVAKEKGLGAVLIKDAVRQGGTDVTNDVIAKMK